VYRSAATTELVPAGVTTRTSFVPAALLGVTAVHVVLEVQVREVIVPLPILMAMTPVKLRPVMVTVVPPALGPWLGLIRVTTGFAATPVPETASAVVPNVPVRVTVPLTGPVTVGANATVALQLARGASVAHGGTARDTAALSLVAPLKDQGTLPVFVSVICLVAREPTAWLPNATGSGVIERALA
jgi:hypothetical protein